MKFDKDKIETDRQIEPDMRTAQILVQIANTLEASIQFTMDCPSLNADRRMAVLDLQMWIHRQDGRMKVAHSFYKKAVASPFTILKRSALPYSVKKSTLLQEALRRLGNISDTVPWKEVASIMSRYSDMLRISGYSHEERLHMVKGVVHRHSEMLEEVRNGRVTIQIQR